MPSSRPAIDFNPDRHEYRVDGFEVPSVTKILRATGVSVDFDALAGMSHRIGLAIADKSAIGQAVHADAHAYDDGDLLINTVDPRVLPFLTSWIEFRNNKPLVPMYRERRVYHPVLHYAGTFDGIFATPDGRAILLDIKTGDPEAAAARYQLAGYQLAFAAAQPDQEIHERWSVQLTPGHRVPYRITPYSDWRDFDAWKAIVATYWCQAGRRRSA